MKYVLITPARNEETFIAKDPRLSAGTDTVARAMDHC